MSATEHLLAAIAEAVIADHEAHVRWRDARGALLAAQEREQEAHNEATLASQKIEQVLGQLRRLAAEEAEDREALAAEGLLPQKAAS